MVSVATTQFYFYIMKADIDRMHTNGHSSVLNRCSLVPIKIQLHKRGNNP